MTEEEQVWTSGRFAMVLIALLAVLVIVHAFLDRNGAIEITISDETIERLGGTEVIIKDLVIRIPAER